MVTRIIDLDSPIENKMRAALIKRNIKFKEQVSVGIKGRDIPKYFIDFVVYGEFCKIAVECDGKAYHSTVEQRGSDASRDLWTITNRFDDVLRFSGSEIHQDIAACVHKISEEILKYDSLKRKRIDLGLIDIRKIRQKSLEYSEIQEVIGVLKREVKGAINSSKTVRLKSKIIKELKKKLQGCNISINDQLVYFVYPFLEKLITKQQVDLFFIAHSITFVLILFEKSNRYLNVPQEIANEDKIVILFVAIGRLNKELEDIKAQNVRQWVLIDGDNCSIIDSDIAEIHQCNIEATESRLKKLGQKTIKKLPSGLENSWKPEEDEELSKDYDAGMSFSELSIKYGRHKGAIQSQLLKIGKKIF